MNELSLLVGRFQPCMHKGHLEMIKGAKYRPCVVMIEAPGTSQNKKKNPLTWAERYDLIQESLFPIYGDEVVFMQYHNGYLPDIVSYLRDNDWNPKEMIAGPDRLANYEMKIEKANQALNTQDKISLEYTEAKRITSSTEVREAIRENDYVKYKSLMPKSAWKHFQFLREKLLQ